MLRLGDRLAWEAADAFGTSCLCVSLEEFVEEYQGSEKPEGSLVHLFSNEQSLKYLYEDFVPRDDDIFICTYAKSGTTWMQQMIYQLVYGPTEDFEDITEKSPWLETRIGHAFLVRNDKYPRIIKTHLRFEHLPKRITEHGKFFFIEREMKDVFASYKRHIVGFGVQLTEETLLDAFLSGKLSLGPYGGYVNSWRHKAPAVLGTRLQTLSFEDMRKDLEATIRTVVSHLEIEVTEEKLQKVAEFSSLAYMKQNVTKFNHNAERKLSRELRGSEIPMQKNFSFVGESKVGSHNALKELSIQRMDNYKTEFGI